MSINTLSISFTIFFLWKSPKQFSLWISGFPKQCFVEMTFNFLWTSDSGQINLILYSNTGWSNFRKWLWRNICLQWKSIALQNMLKPCFSMFCVWRHYHSYERSLNLIPWWEPKWRKCAPFGLTCNKNLSQNTQKRDLLWWERDLLPLSTV